MEEYSMNLIHEAAIIRRDCMEYMDYCVQHGTDRTSHLNRIWPDSIKIHNCNVSYKTD